MLIICPECGKEISDKTDICIHCGYPIGKTKNNIVTINNKEYDFTDIILSIKSEEYNPAVYIGRISDMCSIPVYEAREIYFTIKNEKTFTQPITCDIKPIPNVPKCPTCGSTNVQKIGTVERATSIIGLGLLSKKINKTYKCLNCKCTW